MLFWGCILGILLFAVAFIKNQSKFKEDSLRRQNNYSNLPDKEKVLAKAKENASKLNKKVKK